MAIQMRRGIESNLVRDKLLPGEWAVCTDNGSLIVCYGEGKCKEIASQEDIEESKAEIIEIIKSKIDDINLLKETLNSFGLFIDDSGYLCQKLESEVMKNE